MGILDQIANPAVANVPGSFLKGQLGQQAVTKEKTRKAQEAQVTQIKERLVSGELNQAQAFKEIAMVDPQGAAALNQVFGSIDQTQLRGAFADLAAGLASSDVETQKRFIQMAQTKVQGSALLENITSEMSKITDDKERTKALVQIIQLGQGLGYLPGTKDIPKDKFIETTEGGQAVVQKVGGGFEAQDIKNLKNLPPVVDQKDQQKRIQELRNTIDKQTLNFRTVQEAHDRIAVLADVDSAASDLALIFNFMKMQDPQSVVRESEFKVAADARAWLSKLKPEDESRIPTFVVQMIRKAATGERLTVEQKEDFVGRSTDLFGAAQTTSDKVLGAILERADVDGVSRERVVGKDVLKNYLGRTTPPPTPDSEGLGNASLTPSIDPTSLETTPGEVAEGTVYENIATGEIATYTNGQWVITKKE